MILPYSAITPSLQKRLVIYSLGDESQAFTSYATTSVAVPTADKCWFFQFNVGKPVLVVNAITFNGTATNGNCDIGIWAANGDDPASATWVAGTGSSALSGTSATQIHTMTDVMLGCGMYWCGITFSTTTTNSPIATANGIEFLRAIGFKMSASATIPLSSSKATVTLSTIDAAFMPAFGLVIDQAIAY